MKSLKEKALGGLLLLLLVGNSFANVTIAIVESEGDVVATTEGSLTFTSIGEPVISGSSDLVELFAPRPMLGNLANFPNFFQVGGIADWPSGTDAAVDAVLMFNDPFSGYPTGSPGNGIPYTSILSPVFGSSDGRLLAFAVTGQGAKSRLWLNENYNEGESLAGTSTWTNTTFSDLKLAEGTYVWTLKSGETISVGIGTEAAAALNQSSQGSSASSGPTYPVDTLSSNVLFIMAVLILGAGLIRFRLMV